MLEGFHLVGVSRHPYLELTVPTAWLTRIMPFIRVNALPGRAPGMFTPSAAALANQEPISTRGYDLWAREIAAIERVVQRAALLGLDGASVCENCLDHLYPFLQPPVAAAPGGRWCYIRFQRLYFSGGQAPGVGSFIAGRPRQ